MTLSNLLILTLYIDSAFTRKVWFSSKKDTMIIKLIKNLRLSDIKSLSIDLIDDHLQIVFKKSNNIKYSYEYIDQDLWGVIKKVIKEGVKKTLDKCKNMLIRGVHTTKIMNDYVDFNLKQRFVQLKNVFKRLIHACLYTRRIIVECICKTYFKIVELIRFIFNRIIIKYRSTSRIVSENIFSMLKKSAGILKYFLDKLYTESCSIKNTFCDRSKICYRAINNATRSFMKQKLKFKVE